jgi:cytoskeletal protein RodZ
MGLPIAIRKPSPPPPVEARRAVKDLLLRSSAFSKLSPETQQQIAQDTAEIAGYLAQPEGIPGNQLPTAAALADPDPNQIHQNYQENLKQVNQSGAFKAQAAREGAAVAGMLLQKVNFPDFCAKLIQGVFHAIVQSSIEQMEAYGKLVASVSQTLNQFRDENVSDNQGRDQLVDQFPDMFELGTSDGDSFSGVGSGQPRVRLKDGVDEDTALQRVNSSLPTPVKSMDLSDDENENALVQSARTQLATSRQQLLATMVLMGINRIVVTDGKIQAKIMYDFQARDSAKMQRSATAMDYATDSSGNVQTTSTMEGQSESNQDASSYSKSNDGSEDRQSGAYYTKGTYKYSQQPIITAMSTASETSESALQTKATLSGTVDINFKSDYLPLEKMADSFQIGMIQNAAKPGRGASAAAGGAGAAKGGGPAAGSNASPPPAAGTGGAAAQPGA